MNIQSHAYNYFPKVVHPAIHQSPQRLRGLTLSGSILLMSSVGKVILAILPITLIINLWFASVIGSFEVDIIEEQKAFLQIESENVVLKAEKAQLFSPQYMVAVAADKLSLTVPVPEQIKRM